MAPGCKYDFRKTDTKTGDFSARRVILWPQSATAVFVILLLKYKTKLSIVLPSAILLLFHPMPQNNKR